jgi:hypothetical protein
MCEVDSSKAIAIPQRYKKSCDICMLLDSEASTKTRWHVYKKGFVSSEEDKYVCSGCVEMVKEIRKKCHQKVDNPKHKLFQNWLPWFAKDVPGLAEALKDQLI